MEKYAVVVDDKKDDKKASDGKCIFNCPGCNCLIEAAESNVPKCPDCGTKPFELSKP